LFFDAIGAVFGLVTRLLILNVHLGVELVKLTWRVLVFVTATAIFVLALPYRLMQRRNDSPEWQGWPPPFGMRRGRPLKPDWGLGREV